MKKQSRKKTITDLVLILSMKNTEIIRWNTKRTQFIINQKFSDDNLKAILAKLKVGVEIYGISKDYEIELSGVIEKITSEPFVKVYIKQIPIYYSLEAEFDIAEMETGIFFIDKTKIKFKGNYIWHRLRKEPVFSPDDISGFNIIPSESGENITGLNIEPLGRIVRVSDLSISNSNWITNVTKETGTVINLFYGTNRKKNKNKDVNKVFGNEIGKLQYGTCEVSIPLGHKVGDMERPFGTENIHLEENQGRHISLLNTEELNEDKFYNQLKEKIAQVPDKDALLFIHGYKTSFASAARRTAQLAWDAHFDGAISFFSWPSSGNLFAYFRDSERAKASISDLESFVVKILKQPNVEKLHIIAHSMGNELLSFALKDIVSQTSLSDELKKIQQIILGAPDIDRYVFKKEILPKIEKIGTRKTIYASNKDIALSISKGLRLGSARLGKSGVNLFVSKGIDTIDASSVESNLLGHSYIFESTELMHDINSLVKKGFEPEKRMLRRCNYKKDLAYWVFPIS